jgi:PAS domain S-box-containing protein
VALRNAFDELKLQQFAVDQHAIVAATDAEGRIVYVNDKFCQISKYPREELVGQDHRILNSGHHPKPFFSNLWDTIRRGQVWHGEIKNRAKDGSEYWVETTIVPFTNTESEIFQHVAIRTDITHRKQVESGLQLAKQQAEAADIAKSEFLANMSHEIRTPMTEILGYTELMLDPNQKPDDRDNFIRVIMNNGEHLLAIINDILDLSKIESQQMTTEAIACSPAGIAHETESLLRARAADKNLTLGVEFAGPTPETIASDPTRLRQILVNLTGNAIKFTDSGSVRIVIRIESPPESGNSKIRFDVVDTGIGLNPKQQSKLFKAFSQADTSTTRKFGGTGLGLTISRCLAQMLGGDIVVSSAQGKGSTFSVTVATGPLDNVRMLEDQDQVLQQTNTEPRTGQQHHPTTVNGRILLAEDGLDNQRLLSMILKKAGAQVDIAKNGRLAYEQAMAALNQNHPYDVILMYMQMPEMDGYEATRKLRTSGYKGPIVALTAHAMAGDTEKCCDAGCDDYATKPVKKPDLLKLVNAHLQHRAA